MTAIDRCTAKNVEITTGENAGNTGGIIGGVFTIVDCESNAPLNGVELPLTGEIAEWLIYYNISSLPFTGKGGKK